MSTSCACHWACHVRPASGLNHTPPPAAPTQMRSGFDRSHTIDVRRPPMLLGPASCHSAPGDGAASVLRARARSETSVSTRDSSPGQDSRARNQAERFLWLLRRGGGGASGRGFLGPRHSGGGTSASRLGATFLLRAWGTRVSRRAGQRPRSCNACCSSDALKSRVSPKSLVRRLAITCRERAVRYAKFSR